MASVNSKPKKSKKKPPIDEKNQVKLILSKTFAFFENLKLIYHFGPKTAKASEFLFKQRSIDIVFVIILIFNIDSYVVVLLVSI